MKSVRDLTIYDVISNNARLYPDRDCIVFNEVRLTHRAYKERCDQVAASFLEGGVTMGDRLAVVAHNSHEYMILYGAAAKIGAIVVPVNWRLKPEEVAFIFSDCEPKFVFAGLDFRSMVSNLVRQMSFVERCYTIGGGETTEGFIPFASLYSSSKVQFEVDVASDAGFIIMHTAAVEGHPRGAILSQTNIVFGNLLNMCRYTLSPADCHICFLPLFHVGGLGTTMAMMHAGGKNVILERFDAELALQLIARERGTIFINFAPILKTLMDQYEKGVYDLTSLRHVMGLDHPENIQRFSKLFPHAQYWTGYGQTEVAGVSFAPFEERPGSAGKPSSMAKVVLLDEYDREVPAGTLGEICVRSPAVFLGYWRREEDTAQTFRNGWHHTGDMGRLDQDGYLWYVKRKSAKELIKPGGENVYPAEVEKAILEHEAVAEVSVIGVPDKHWGEAIKAVCVLKTGKALEPQELIDFVASKIARYKKPHHVVFVESLPRTADGEIDRDQVKKAHGGHR